nr:hypothetical protein [Ktedonospora formicarum]
MTDQGRSYESMIRQLDAWGANFGA